MILYVNFTLTFVFSPLPKYRWEYQGIGLRSRWLSTSSKELNFEFFRIKGGGHSLDITRVTRYTVFVAGNIHCYRDWPCILNLQFTEFSER